MQFAERLKQHATNRLKTIAQQKQSVPVYSLADFCFPEQIAFIESKARYKTARCSRRAGKTTSIAHYIRHIARNGHGYDCLYITKTRETAERIIWQMLKDVVRKYGDDVKVNESKLTIYFKDTNSWCYLKGAKDTAEIEKLRGQKFKLAVIDEAQIFPGYIKYLIDEILEPALADLQGTLCATGTPNASCAGWFYDVDHHDYWEHHHWTWRDNRYFLESALRENHLLTSADDIISEVCKKRSTNISDPVIQREWLGNWVRSTDLLVYKYNGDINNFVQLPQKPWKYVLGVDLGFNDSDALVITAYSELLRECYVVEQVKKNKLTISQLATEIQLLKTQYNPYYCVIDAGALGKKIQEELNQRFGFAFIAADKTRKGEFIELLNSDLRLGHVKIKSNSELAQEMQMLCWDSDEFENSRYIEDEHFDNHLCDAFLYSWRHLYNYHYVKLEEKPKWGTIEYELQREREHEERVEQRLRDQKNIWDNDSDWQ